MKLLQLLKQFLHDDNADTRMIGGVVAILVTLIVAVLVFYNIAGSIDTADIDKNFGGENETPAQNATQATMDQAGTFFSIAPIIAIVAVAVVILGYVTRIGG